MAFALAIGFCSATQSPVAHAQRLGLSSPEEAKANPALDNAKRRLDSVENEIRDAERELRRLSPPVRTTDSKGVTTVDQNAQRSYEQNRDVWSKKVQSLRKEQLVWQIQANQLIAMETAQRNAAQVAPVPTLALPPTIIYVPVPAPVPAPAAN